MISLDDLTREPTEDETSQSVFNLLASAGFPVTAWQLGTPGRTLVELVGKFLSSLPLSIRQIAEMGLLSRSAGSWLTLYAQQRYGIDRAAAIFARGTLQLTNATAGTLTYDPQELIAASSTGKLFRNTGAISIAAGATASVTFEAEQPGYLYNVNAGSITKLATPHPGLTVTSPAIGTTGTWLTVYGADEESDDRLRTRCQGRWGELSLGSPDRAYQKWVLDASAQVTKVTVSTPGYGGIIRIRLAGPSGGVLSSVVDDVSDYLEGVTDGTLRRALCATLDIASASTLTIPITGTVTVSPGKIRTAKPAIEARLLAYFASIPIGGQVRAAQILEEIMVPAGVVDCALVTPAANIGLSTDQTAAASISLVYTT